MVNRDPEEEFQFKKRQLLKAKLTAPGSDKVF